ncbi:hypothetical protein Hanom_Chr12g01100911 [Helianthus anomalus]
MCLPLISMYPAFASDEIPITDIVVTNNDCGGGNKKFRKIEGMAILILSCFVCVFLNCFWCYVMSINPVKWTENGI